MKKGKCWIIHRPDALASGINPCRGCNVFFISPTGISHRARKKKGKQKRSIRLYIVIRENITAMIDRQTVINHIRKYTRRAISHSCEPPQNRYAIIRSPISHAANNGTTIRRRTKKFARDRKVQRYPHAREFCAHLHNKKKYNYAANGHVGRCS